MYSLIPCKLYRTPKIEWFKSHFRSSKDSEFIWESSAFNTRLGTQETEKSESNKTKKLCEEQEEEERDSIENTSQ